uniref:Tubulin polymerization promoting protein family member 2 n=1 Tax=Otolemur garnettii TaxID=30611 RepID=H0XCE1_OTOGA
MASEAEKTFKKFAAFEDSSSNGTEMNNKNFSKLCKDCGIIDGKTVTTTDVDTAFNKAKLTRGKNGGNITFQQFTEAMKELAQKRFKEKSPDEGLKDMYKLMEGKEPATTASLKATTVGAVDHLTDIKYTGSHKKHFDESGKGKDITGWEETTDGCVSGNKGAGTNDKKN